MCVCVRVCVCVCMCVRVVRVRCVCGMHLVLIIFTVLPKESLAISCTGLNTSGSAQDAHAALHSRTLGAVRWLSKEAKL